MKLASFFYKNKKYILFVFILLFLISLIIYLIHNITTNTKPPTNTNKPTIIDKTSLYDNLMNNFNKIFPDNNRNAGGPQFFKFIVDLNTSKKEFEIYNTFYCGVSGSPIDPSRKDNFEYTIIKDINNNDIYGKYYKCCWPCVCDIMKYAIVDDFTISFDNNKHTYKVLTINDPCSDVNNIPNEVTSFICSNNITSNGVLSDNNRLIFALFHEARPANDLDHNNISDILDKCRDRNNTNPDMLKGGMGDIFVKLSLLNKDDNYLKNIYGNKLKKCKTGDSPGSWDNGGLCSEKDGGVHQICFDVNNQTMNFSEETYQGNWSEGRLGNNHCMCLGAWALYKSKNKGNNNELICDAIPDMALNINYVDKWNKWNGNELPDQIINGVDSLVKQCYNKNNSSFLKNKYDNLRKFYINNNNIQWNSII